MPSPTRSWQARSRSSRQSLRRLVRRPPPAQPTLYTARSPLAVFHSPRPTLYMYSALLSLPAGLRPSLLYVALRLGSQPCTKTLSCFECRNSLVLNRAHVWVAWLPNRLIGNPYPPLVPPRPVPFSLASLASHIVYRESERGGAGHSWRVRIDALRSRLERSHRPGPRDVLSTRALILHLLFLALSNPAQYPFVPPP